MMKNSGQRQDVAFLALAVAVLAVAVALFVGMKSLQRERPKKSAPTASQKVATKQKSSSKSTQGVPRDPFKTQGGAGAAGAGRTGTSPAREIKLVGIVAEQGDRPVAILRAGKKRYYAKVGDKAAGYTVLSIGQDNATLGKDSETLTLELRTPEPEE